MMRLMFTSSARLVFKLCFFHEKKQSYIRKTVNFVCLESQCLLYSIFTTTTLKQGFYDPNHLENHTREKEKRKGVKIRRKKKD